MIILKVIQDETGKFENLMKLGNRVTGKRHRKKYYLSEGVRVPQPVVNVHLTPKIFFFA